MMRSTPSCVKTLDSIATSPPRPRWARPPMPEYSPSVFSRTKSMSTSAGPLPASGQATPSSSRAGRTFAHRSRRWRISSTSSHSETWSGTDGSARDERRSATLEQVDRGRPDAAAHRRAAADDRVGLLCQQDRREVRAEEPRRALLEHDRLVVVRLEPRVDLDPAAPSLKCPECRDFLEPEAAVLEAGLVADRREHDRQPLRTG